MSRWSSPIGSVKHRTRTRPPVQWRPPASLPGKLVRPSTTSSSPMKTWGCDDLCVERLVVDERDGPSSGSARFPSGSMADVIAGGFVPHWRSTEGPNEARARGMLRPSTSIRTTRGGLGVDGSALAVIFLRSAGAGRSTYDCTFYSVHVRFAKAFRLVVSGNGTTGSCSPRRYRRNTALWGRNVRTGVDQALRVILPSAAAPAGNALQGDAQGIHHLEIRHARCRPDQAEEGVRPHRRVQRS